jgi:hypothetical protein
MMEALNSSEMSFLIRATRRKVLEDAILLSHRREYLTSYKGNIISLQELDSSCSQPLQLHETFPGCKRPPTAGGMDLAYRCI